MTRQEQLNAIGRLKPSLFEYDGKKSTNHISYFIIPVPHKVYDTKDPKKFFAIVKESHWSIINPKDENLRPYDTNKSIKKYIYENFIPILKDEEKEIIYENKNLLLNFKIKHSSKLNINGEIFDILLNDIDLWILDEHIAFFVLKVELPTEHSFNVTTISSKLNRSFRDFRNIYVDNDIFYTENRGISLIEWLFSLTCKDKESFLCIKPEKFEKEFYHIYHTSYYAKMLTAIHIDSDTVDGVEIEPPFENNLIFDDIDSIGVLDEVAFYLATTSDIYPSRNYETDEEYIYAMFKKGGISLWKYWTGIALDDSVAFFSLKSGGSGIVNECRNLNYLLYILNLYINYKLRDFEHTLIDKDFTNLDKIYSKFIEFQQLRNETLTQEVAIKFQPNEIHSSIAKALRTEEIFGEVKENIIDTLELTKSNTDIIITIGGASVTFLGVWISQDELLGFYDSHPVITVFSILVFVIIMVAIIAKRSKVIKFFKNNFKKIKNFFKSSSCKR